MNWLAGKIWWKRKEKLGIDCFKLIFYNHL